MTKRPSNKKKAEGRLLLGSLPTGYVQTRAQTFRPATVYSRKVKHQGRVEA